MAYEVRPEAEDSWGVENNPPAVASVAQLVGSSTRN